MHPAKGFVLCLVAALIVSIAWGGVMAFVLPQIATLVSWNLGNVAFYGGPTLAIVSTIVIAVLAPRVRPWTVLVIPLVLIIGIWAETVSALGLCMHFPIGGCM